MIWLSFLSIVYVSYVVSLFLIVVMVGLDVTVMNVGVKLVGCIC